MEEYAFPANLYIIGAMNTADASIAPLDVAFLRRWSAYRLRPNSDVLDTIFGITDKTIKDAPTSIQDVYNIAVRAWDKINERIAIGRGEDYQIGHGVFLVFHDSIAKSIDDAKEEMARVWPYLLTHVEECFWGDTSAISSVLNIKRGIATHPYTLVTEMFAGEEHSRIKYADISSANIYDLFRAIIGD
jgi:5-methylcytosine-specific restriction protein B